MKTDVAYIAYTPEGDTAITVNKYSSLVSSEGENTIHFGFNLRFKEGWNGSKLVVNDGIAYLLATSGSSYKIFKFDFSKAKMGEELESSDSISVSVPEGSTITDMLYQDECIYLLAREFKLDYTSTFSNNSGCGFSSRGDVIEVDLFTGDSSFVSQNIEAYTTFIFKNDDETEINESYMMFKGGTYRYPDQGDNDSLSVLLDLQLYSDEAGAPYIMTAAQLVEKDYSLTTRETKVPLLSVLEGKEPVLAGPQKFVAIKPKKLVIADNGIAFYLDDGVWKYKNVNRIVTVDLDKFAIESSVEAGVKFETGFSVPLLFAGSTFYVACPPNSSMYLHSGSEYTSGSAYAGIPCGD